MKKTNKTIRVKGWIHMRMTNMKPYEIILSRKKPKCPSGLFTQKCIVPCEIVYKINKKTK